MGNEAIVEKCAEGVCVYVCLRYVSVNVAIYTRRLRVIYGKKENRNGKMKISWITLKERVCLGCITVQISLNTHIKRVGEFGFLLTWWDHGFSTVGINRQLFGSKRLMIY